MVEGEGAKSRRARRRAERSTPKQTPQTVAEAVQLAEAVEAAASPRLSLGARLRNNLVTGLLVTGPVAVTLYITSWVVTAVDNWVKPYFPKAYNPDTYLPFPIPGAGILFAIISLMLIGALAANLIGRTLIGAGERMLERMPIVRNLYRGTKQLFESVVTASGPEQAFQKVAVMEFPSPGIFALVFITGAASAPIAALQPEDDLIAVFMPTHLMPPSGFTVFVPRRRVRVIDMSIEDAAKIILSAGMVTPDRQEQLRQLAAGAGEPRTEPRMAKYVEPV